LISSISTTSSIDLSESFAINASLSKARLSQSPLNSSHTSSSNLLPCLSPTTPCFFSSGSSHPIYLFSYLMQKESCRLI
jgi:hypothetical protein